MTTITTVFLPVALAIIMLGLGLTLTTADFRRVLTQPRAVAIALAAQVLLLPLVAFALCYLLALPPTLSVGMMLLAASPGGTSASLFSHLARGDVALNVTLTAVNSVLAIVTLPLLLGLSLGYFLGEAREVALQYGKLVQVATLVIAPVGVGMLLRAFRPAFAAACERPVRKLSVLLLAMIIALVFVQSHATIRAHLLDVGGVALAFNLLSLAIGYWLPRLLGLGDRQCVAIGMEIGVHNSGLAITIALSPLVLNNPAMAIPATLYSPIMMLTAGAFAAWTVRQQRGPAPLTVAQAD
jgi:BASS family bile acid:Na+ symporter